MSEPEEVLNIKTEEHWHAKFRGDPDFRPSMPEQAAPQVAPPPVADPLAVHIEPSGHSRKTDVHWAMISRGRLRND